MPRIALFLLFWASAKLISKLGHTNCDIDTYTPLSLAITDSTHRNLLCGLCTNTGLLLGNPTRKPANNINRDIHSNFITFLVLLLSGDIQLNPGPKYEDIYPCGFCAKPVDWSTPGICCGNCEIWFHCPCVDIGSLEYDRLGHESQFWDCYRCKSRNDSTIYHAYNVDVRNSFSALSLLGEDSVFLPHSPSLLFHQVLHSSPKAQNTPQGHARFDSSKSLPSSIMTDSVKSPSQSCENASHTMPSYKSSAIPSKKQNLRTIVLNCNSIRNKSAELENLVNTTDPDIIIMSETKLNPSIGSSEFLPPGYKGFRKDRATEDGGGGVMIVTKDSFIVEEVEISDIKCETSWIKIT